MIELDDLETKFVERRRSHGLRPNLEMTGEGLMLGAGTLLARPRAGERALAKDDEGPRILALLAAAGPAGEVAQEAKCSAFITESILREFPSEYLDLSVNQVLNDANAGIAAAKKAKKLLFNNRFRK